MMKPPLALSFEVMKTEVNYYFRANFMLYDDDDVDVDGDDVDS